MIHKTTLAWSEANLFKMVLRQPKNPSNHLSKAFEIDGPVDADSLEQAFQIIYENNSNLHVSYHVNPRTQKPEKWFDGPKTVKLKVIEVASEAELKRVAGEKLAEIYDVKKPPLIRMNLVRLKDNPNRSILVTSVSHLAADGWSAYVFYKTLEKLYNSLLKIKKQQPLCQYWPFRAIVKKLLETSLPGHAFGGEQGSFETFTEKQNTLLSRLEDTATYKYYAKIKARVKEVKQKSKSAKGKKNKVETSAAAKPQPGPATPKPYLASVVAPKLDAATTKKIDDLCEKYKASRPRMLFALTQLMLYEFTGRQETLIRSAYHNRGPHDKTVMGYMGHGSAIYLAMKDDMTFAQLLKSLGDEFKKQKTSDGNSSPSDLPTSAVLGPDCLPQFGVNYLKTDFTLNLDGAKVRSDGNWQPKGIKTSWFCRGLYEVGLDVYFNDNDGELTLQIMTVNSVYPEDTVEKVQQLFLDTLERVYINAADATKTLDDILKTNPNKVFKPIEKDTSAMHRPEPAQKPPVSKHWLAPETIIAHGVPAAVITAGAAAAYGGYRLVTKA